MVVVVVASICAVQRMLT